MFTEDDIRQAGENIRPVESGGQNGSRFNPEPHFKGPHDFYKNLIANYLKVNSANESTQTQDQEKPAGDKPQAGKDTPINWDNVINEDRLSSMSESELDMVANIFRKGNKPEAKGAGEASRDYGTADKPDTVALGEYFAEQFEAGKGYSDLRAAKLLGGKQTIAPEHFKAIDEAIELGVVQAARKTVSEMRENGKSDGEIFQALVGLYKRQPILSSRTSQSVEQQAYSTPAPIAFLASRLAGINENTKVYEPTAGNGMLLMEARPENAIVNELNGERARRLEAQGFEVTEEDAAKFLSENKVDVVIENPPFGRVWNDAHTETIELDVDGFATSELDQAIVVKSLHALKDRGRAVLIIGGKQGAGEARRKKYATASQVEFYKYLSENFNIFDHFSIDGKLYSRQGAAYPIDIIVVDKQGKSEGYVFPGGKPPRVYHSFEQLEEQFNGEMDTGRIPSGDAALTGGRDAGGESAGTDVNDRGLSSDDVQGGNRQGNERRGESRGDNGNGQNVSERAEGERAGDVEQPGRDSDGSSRQGERGDLEYAGRRGAPGENNDVADREGRDVSAQSEEGRGSGGLHQERSGELGRNDSAELVEEKRREKKLKPTEHQTPYEKASKLPSLGTLVPKNMATAVKNAFAKFRKEHGDIDKFVAKELGYEESELGKHFAAEQVDAIGLAIHNLQKGAGFIIGDQTGIGKESVT